MEMLAVEEAGQRLWVRACRGSGTSSREHSRTHVINAQPGSGENAKEQIGNASERNAWVEDGCLLNSCTPSALLLPLTLIKRHCQS